MTLSAQALTKRYGTAAGHEAVRDASLELEVGEFVSIVGRSGSGKSTLMAMLGALTRPTEGTLLLDGTDVWTLSEAELATFRSRRIGFIFQFPSLLSNLTAVDNVAVPALLGRTMDAGQAYARAHDLLARVGLRDRADAYPGSMSGGEQRRVAIARALINSPPLLLADEPTSDLDEDTETDIIDLLEQLQRTESFGFVLVTHNLELAKRARRTFEMRQGDARGQPTCRGSRWIRNVHGTSDQPRSTRRRTWRCPRPRWFRPSAWAPACGSPKFPSTTTPFIAEKWWCIIRSTWPAPTMNCMLRSHKSVRRVTCRPGSRDWRPRSKRRNRRERNSTSGWATHRGISATL